jgi:hypothetical protein
MAKVGELYEQDFFLWTKEQAAALRLAKSLPLARTGDSNLPLDWENLAEEIESLGKSDRRELRSRIPSLQAGCLFRNAAARRMALDNPRGADGDRGCLARQPKPSP